MGSAVAGDTAALPGLKTLGTGVSNYLEDQLVNNYNVAIPDYSGLAAQSSQNIGSELRGELPQDVINQITQNAAERGIITGTSGSGNAEAALLRSLGLTSLNMTGLGEQNLSGAVARSPIAKPFDISSLFITPEQVQEAQTMANVYASAPDPAAAGQHMEALARGGAGAEELPWYVSAGERAALSSPGGAHYSPMGQWMPSVGGGVF
jgi:hypothetical protein